MDGTGFRAAYKFNSPIQIKNRTQYIEINFENSSKKINISMLLVFEIFIFELFIFF